MKKEEPIHVTCAILEHEGKVLAALRGRNMANAGMWEFPGGKIEQGETPELCLLREIREELGVTITLQQKLAPVTWQYPEKLIKLYPYICTYNGATLIPVEHQQVSWFSLHELSGLNWSAADVLVLKQYMGLYPDKNQDKAPR